MNVETANAEDFAWIAEKLRTPIAGDFRALKAVDSSGKIRGMVGFSHWTRNSVQALFAIDTPIAMRSLLRPTFGVPFEQLGLGVMLTFVPSHSRRGLALAKSLGFREACRIKDGFASGDDLLLFEMTRAECPWLRTSERKDN